MTVTFTLNSMYLGTEAGPFNISGVTSSNVTTQLVVNASLQDLTTGITVGGIDDNTIEFIIQSDGVCVNYIVKPVSNCNCPEGYTASSDGTICYKVTTASPTTNDTLTPEAGADNPAYGEYGVKIYNIGDFDSTGNSISGGLAFSGYTNTFDGSGTTDVEAFWSTRMNANNVWVAGDANWPGPNYPDYISFCATFTLTQSKTYWVGIAGDNDVTIKLNGAEIVNQADNSPQSNFKFWHIYPVTLNAGPNIIELENWNRSSVGSFAAEIYDNELSALFSATNTSMLNIVFATGDYLPGGSKEGQGFCSNYTCPSGYTLDTTDPQNPVCKLIETSSCVSSQYFAFLATVHTGEEACQIHALNAYNVTTQPVSFTGGSNLCNITRLELSGVDITNLGNSMNTQPIWVSDGSNYRLGTLDATGVSFSPSDWCTSCSITPNPTPTATATSSTEDFVAFASNRVIACNISTPASTYVYYSAPNWNSLQVGDILYSDSGLSTPAANGYYYNSAASAGREVVRMAVGEITSITDCNGNTI